MSEADAAVCAALEGFAAGRAALAAGVSVAELRGGLDNRSFRVHSTAGRWVVRIAGDRDERYLVNRVAERQSQAAAAALGFAPAVLYADPARGVLVSEFLDGAPWTRARVVASDGLRTLGARLAELHRVPPPRGVRRVDVHGVLAHYLEQPVAQRGPVTRDDLTARLRWSLATYRPPPPAFCHNDLHHGNLLGEAPLRFVDWEYAGVGDPLFELAAVVGYHDLGEAERSVLIDAHGGNFDAADVARMCRVFDCLHALWLDVAGGWESLAAGRRDALVARLKVDPAERRRGRRAPSPPPVA